MKNKAGFILLVLSVVYAVSFFHKANLTVLSLDIINDLQISTVDFGILGSFTFLGYALAQIPSGMLADILGGRKTLVIFQCLAAIASMMFSMSDTLSSATISRFILGFALAANVPAMKVLASWFSASQYSKANSILLSCASLGTLLASSPLAFSTELVGWRATLFAMGIITFVLAILTWIYVADKPQSQVEPILEKAEEKAEKVNKKVKFNYLIKLVLKQKNFKPAFVWFFCMIGIYFVLGTMWWGPFLMQVYDLTRAEAGVILSIMSLIPLVTNPFIAVLSDSVFRSRKIILFMGAGGSFVILFALSFFLESIPQYVVLYGMGVLFTFFLMSTASLVFTLVKESVPIECAGTAFGMINTGAPLCSFFAQYLFGYLVGYGAEQANFATGYSYGFASLLILNFVAIIANFYIEDTLSPDFKLADQENV